MDIHQKYIRFFRYTLVGGSTFLLDLLLLSLCIDFFGLNSTLSAGVSFLIAVSINYRISQAWVFRGSQKGEISVASGFLSIALAGLGIVSVGMYLLTSLLHIHYLVARILVAFLTGFWNYLINLYINFKVAGEQL